MHVFVRFYKCLIIVIIIIICQMQCLIARIKGNCAHRLARTQKQGVCTLHIKAASACLHRSLPEDSEQEYSVTYLLTFHAAGVSRRQVTKWSKMSKLWNLVTIQADPKKLATII